MAVDLSKPKPKCDCYLMDAYNSWVCKGCEWQEAWDERNRQKFINIRSEMENALNKFLQNFDPTVIDALETVLRRSRMGSDIKEQLADLKMMLTPLVKFVENEEYEWHYNSNKKIKELWESLGQLK